MNVEIVIVRVGEPRNTHLHLLADPIRRRAGEGKDKGVAVVPFHAIILASRGWWNPVSSPGPSDGRGSRWSDGSRRRVGSEAKHGQPSSERAENKSKQDANAGERRFRRCIFFHRWMVMVFGRQAGGMVRENSKLMVKNGLSFSTQLVLRHREWRNRGPT